MADNEKLVFQIGFDLDSAVKDATSEWKRVQRELEAAINARPISISMDTRGLERFNTFVERTYASLEDLQDLFPEVFKETKDGEGITKRFQAMETSINAVSKEMRNLEKVWNNLSQAEKFDDDGNLTDRAQELKRAYVELYQSQKTQGQTLQEITKEAINLANQEYEAQQRKKKQEEEFVRLLNLEETTLEKLQAKQGAWKQKLSQTEIGSSDWSNAIAEVQRLETKMKDLQKQIKGVATETKKTSKTKVDIDTSTFAGKLKDLENRWKALNAEQRKGAEGQALRAEWRKLSEEAGRYTSTLRSAVSAEDRLANAKKKTTQATHAQNSAYKTQSTYLSRLMQRMIAYASVVQAMSFLRNIKDVTAEFEMQRVSLGALIQDAQKANMIFERIKMQAVKSPYEVQDLVRYTKQLAAYGVEADELISTMNQLADISAGLGTEMDRIILAYGQIQAAGVLKGTELKQLAELGLPMVELLADYYSTLRDEVVTTSEVFDMMSNKEIPFEDVQAVLEALTSEGGRFHEMQATQAETLQGSWANLKDTLSLMFDEIGRSEAVQGLLRGFIDLTKALARNWNEIWQAIKVVGLTYGSLKVGATIMRVTGTTTMTARAALRQYALASKQASTAMASQGRIAGMFGKRLQYVAWCQLKATKATNILTRSFYKLGAVIMANPIGAITTLVGVIAGFVAYTKSAGEEVKTFEDEQKEYYDSAVKNIELTVDKFKKLAQMVVVYTEGSEEQQRALQNLKDQFGDMFPEYQLTLEYLRGLVEEAGNASTAFDSMGQSIQASMASKLRQDLIDKVYEKLDTEYTKIFEMARSGELQFLHKLPLMVKYINEGKDAMEAMALALDYVNFEGIRIPVYDEKGFLKKTRQARISDFADDFDRLQEYINNLPPDSEYRIELVALYDYLRMLQDVDYEIQKIDRDIDMLEGTYGEINKIIQTAESKLAEGYSNMGADLLTITLGEILREAHSPEKYREISKAISENLGEQTWDKILAEYSDGKLFGVQLSDEAIYGITQLKKVFAIYNDEWRNFLSKQEGFVGDKKIEVFTNREIENFGSLYDAVEKISKAYEDAYKTLEEYKNLRSETDDEEAIAIYDKQIAKLEEQNRQRKAFLDEYGSLVKSDKDDNKALKERQTLLKDELSTVEKIYKEYQGLRKYMSEADAQATINKMFGSVSFEILGMATSFEEMKEQLNKALKEAKRLGDTKLAMDIEYKIGKMDADEIQKNMEKELKRLSDQLSRTKTAKEFFNKMLGLTGDKQLSATLTMSVYGVTQDADLGSELGKSIAKQMQDQVQKYFGDIDISSAINKATGEIDPIGLEKLLTKENMAKIGEKDVENIRKIISDLISTDAKFWNEMMKDLEKTQTYGDKLVKVYETLQKRIEAIRSREDLDETTKGNLIDQVKANAEKEMSKLQYEAFKDSPLYVAMFEKLDATSTTMLTNMRNHLEALKGEWKNSLDPSQLKELQERINDIDKQLSSRNPFKGMIDGFKEFSDLRKARSRKDDESKAFNATKKRLEAEKAYEQAVAEGKPSEEIARLAKELDNCVEAENDATTNMREWDDAMQKVLQGAQELKKYTQIIQETTTAVNDIVEAFGGWGNSVDETFWNTMLDGINKFVGGVESATLGVGKIMVGDIVGGVTSLISGIGSIVSSIGNYIYADRIRNADKGIEQLQDRLNSLSYAYDRLQSAQEKAFGTDYISNYERQLENLEAQQEAYLKQADLERSKGKKADEDKIKEYEEQARNTADAIKDMYGSLSEHFFGQDLASAARDFASAWIDAYKEFSNTTDAMKQKFQDMIQNMVVESLLAKVMERALEPVFTMIDEMQAEDFYSTSFWQRVMATMQTATENGVVGAENVMSMLEQMGINLRGLGGEMTGISRDIATASEESILGLAAGINTQNFYISQVPTKLDTIIGLLRGDGAIPQGSAMTLQDVMIAQNQFLSHLPTIAQHTAETVAECKQIVVETRRTADALDRVIKPKGTQTTHTLNTTIN